MISNLLIYSRPDLIKEWVFEKNISLGLDLDNITHGSDKTAWWKCRKCNSVYDMKVELRARKSINCPYCAGKRANGTNSLSALNPELALQWHPTLNSLTPHDVTSFSGKKAWWICPKCKSSYDSQIRARSEGNGCPYCHGLRVNHTNSLASLNPQLASEWHPIKNGELTPNDVTCSTGKKVWWLGECGHEWDSAIFSRSTGIGCPYCANKKLLKGFNDMWTSNPELAKLLADPSDGYKYTQSSGKRVNWKCIWCNKIIKNIAPTRAITSPPACDVCKTGKSFGEKLVGNVLYINNIDFIREKTFGWSNGRKYDFFLFDLNMIIEVHGMQHFERGFESLGGKSLEEEQENDKYKYEMAIRNGIKPENYIVIDCRKSDFEFIVDSIECTMLSNILSNKDYKSALSINLDPMVIKSSKMYDNNIDIKQISKNIGYSKETVRKFLRVGSILGINNYKPFNKSGGIGIVQMDVNFNEIQRWNSRTEACKSNNFKSIAYSTMGKIVISRDYIWCREYEYDDFIKKFKGAVTSEKQ